MASCWEVVIWSINRWLENIWESEDGSSRKVLWSWMKDWDNPLCWLTNQTIAILGMKKELEDEDEPDYLINMVRI